ncbi:MAG: nickel insertion protein, partial [Lachnospiraceae bacterium]
MKTLYLDCSMGAAGDMLAGALLELLPEPEVFLKELNALGLDGVSVGKEKAVKCGIMGTHFSVKVRGEEEESEDIHNSPHPHDHHHGNHSHHPHSHSH